MMDTVGPQPPPNTLRCLYNGGAIPVGRETVASDAGPPIQYQVWIAPRAGAIPTLLYLQGSGDVIEGLSTFFQWLAMCKAGLERSGVDIEALRESGLHYRAVVVLDTERSFVRSLECVPVDRTDAARYNLAHAMVQWFAPQDVVF